MFWPWMPPGAAPGGRSSGDSLPTGTAGVVVVEAPPAGTDVVTCANAPPHSAAASAAAAQASRNFRIVVLPPHRAHLHLRLPAGAVAGLPVLGQELAVGALPGGGVGLDAAGGLFALGAGGKRHRGGSEDQERSHDLPPFGWPACFEPYAVP